ncbi:hypothetical protein INT47_000198 [Mucor saturninus]|uniref:Laccase n=1 Tax=Mucor saturninus TaxID=64648 RepID=A0A8H7R4S7_9FUNG|nr:hypothetical protein INT47_000198 [Mucor saturninus]
MVVNIFALEQDGSTRGSVKSFELNLSLEYLNPDCYNTSFAVMVVNNQFPAPALHVVKNDVVRFIIRNSDAANNQSSSIHIHGIRQYGTTFSDGVAAITQLAIAPGQEFIQEFQVLNQSGTYFYHAHVGVQDDTITGPFIVHEDQDSFSAATELMTPVTEGIYTYDEERILQWTEFWHQSGYDREKYYTGSSFINDNGPDSVLLNGRTVYNSSASQNDCECAGFSYINVEPNKIYRFRFIGALTFRILGIFIQDHNMTLMEIDGEYVAPYNLKYLEIGAGQRMSVLVKTGNYPAGSLFPIASNFRWRINAAGFTENGYGYLRYVNATTPTTTIIMDKPIIANFPANIFPAIDIPGWVLRDVKPLVSTERDIMILNRTADRTIKLFMQQVTELDNTTRFRNNDRMHVPWGNSSSSLLEQVIANSLGTIGTLDVTDGFSLSHQTYPVNFGEVIDFVFQNSFNGGGVCVAHPWHTHGHSHYLISEGEGDYLHETDKDVRSFADPLLKDVSIAYPAIVNGSIGCGWTKVRILAVTLPRYQLVN